MVRCTECGSKDFRKNGKKGDLQRFLCKNERCGSSFSFGTKAKIPYESKALAIFLYECGETYVSKRELAVIIGCAVGAVYRWKKAKKRIMSKISKKDVDWVKIFFSLVAKSGLELGLERSKSIANKISQNCINC